MTVIGEGSCSWKEEKFELVVLGEKQTFILWKEAPFG